VLAGIFHSAWKRRLQVKDSSVLIPEMGGILDMVDSLLLAGPVAWAWLRLGL
jgi:CDP-diglyceride synthetase